MASSPAGCEACLNTERRLQRNTASKLTVQQLSCYAGLTVVSVPVLVDGRHVATLMSGQVFRREPTERDFGMLAGMVGGGMGSDWERKAHRAYFETPVVRADQFQATVQLLSMFAQYLADHASRQAIASSNEEPRAVASAKEFVQAHVEETLTLDDVLEHVHVSRFYFCKLFKKSTGLTLTEYVARVRVERAKKMLVDPAMRVSEVVFATGFGSISQFNSLFKRLVGVPPTEYRASFRAPESR